jgi:hypothetical protein
MKFVNILILLLVFLIGMYIGTCLIVDNQLNPLYHCYQVNTISPQSIVWNQYKDSDAGLSPFCSVRVVFDGQVKFLTAEQYLEFIKETK